MRLFSEGVRKGFNIVPVTTGAAAVQSGADLDMSGFKGVYFEHVIGNSTTIVTLIAQGSDSTTAGTFQAISGASAASTVANSNKILGIDLWNPQFRYVRCTLQSTGLLNNGGGVTYTQYGPTRQPTTHNSTDLGASIVQVKYGTT